HAFPTRRSSDPDDAIRSIRLIATRLADAVVDVRGVAWSGEDEEEEAPTAPRHEPRHLAADEFTEEQLEEMRAQEVEEPVPASEPTREPVRWAEPDVDAAQ